MRRPGCEHDTSSQTRCERCGEDVSSGAQAGRESLRRSSPELRAVEGERREVTVLCADLKGSTALASRLDPETYHDILNRVLQQMSEAVHSEGGTVNQFTGDGIIALFGAAGSREEHVTRALTAALSIQEGLGETLNRLNQEQNIELGFRVGLHTGKVFVGRIGDDLRMDYTAQGLTTDLAQRTESLALPGQILVTEAVFSRAREAFRFLERGKLEGGGLPSPVPVFSLEGTLSDPEGAPFALPTRHGHRHSSPQSYTPRHLAEQILKYRSALEGEHKSVTILFAELTGAPQLETLLSPEECHEILDGALGRMFAAVHGVEGTVNQFTGDGIMALFGAPIAHEDHVQRALEAALSIRESLSPYLAELRREARVELGFRVGLNTGKVFVGRIGDDLRMDYTAQGLTTNLAQRMESLALPGQILVTEAIWRLAGGAFRFGELGKQQVKGLSEPIPVFSLDGKNDAVSRLEAAAARGLSPFVGREEELATLSGLWERVSVGQGQLCYVIGPAGVGKSRLVYEFIRSLPGARAITVQALSYGDTFLYYPFRLLCREVLQISADEPAESITALVEERLCARGLSAIYAPFLAALVGGKPEDQRFSGLEAKERQQRTHEAVRELLLQAARECPLVVLFEDLHWLDSASRALFDFLVGEIKNAPMLFFGTARPGFVPTFQDSPHITQLSLTELPRAALIELIDCMLAPSRAAPSLYEFLLERTAGNALFVEELLRTLRAHEGLRETSEGLALAQDRVALPPTLQSLFSARLDRLSEDAKQVALTASAIGLTTPLGLLSRAVEKPDRLGESISELAQQAVLSHREGEEGGEVRFINALLQETAYTSLLRPQRQALHLRIARALEELYRQDLDGQAEALAYHYQRSAQPERALAYLRKAAARARAVYALKDALERLGEALKILGQQPPSPARDRQRVEILLEQERVYETLGQRARQQQVIDEALGLLQREEDAALRAEALVRYGDLYTHLGRFSEAEQALTEALARQQAARDSAGEAQVLRSLGYLRWNQDRYLDAVAYNEAALAIDRRLGDSARIANDISNLGTLYRYLGEHSRALSHLTEALQIYEELQNPHKQAFTLYNMAHVLKDMGLPEQAEARYQRARDLFLENRDQLMASRAMSGLANLYLDQGRAREGLALYQEVLRLSRKIQYGQGISHALRTLGEIYFALGSPEEALRYFLESTTVFAALQDYASEIQIWKKIAGIFENTLGDLNEARSAWKKVQTLSTKSASPSDKLEALQHLGRLSRKLPGHAKEALSYFEEALKLAEASGDAPTVGSLLNTVAILYWGEGKPERALACYQRALRVYRELKDDAREGLILNSLGATLRRLGRDEEALDYFLLAIQKNQQTGQKLFLGHGLSALGDIYYDRKEYLKAIFQYHASLTIRKEINDRKGEGWMNYSLAKSHAGQGNQSQAVKFLSLAEEIADECDEKELLHACAATRTQLFREKDE